MNTTDKPSNLHQKRFKLIADYPKAPGPIGTIIHIPSIPEYDDSESYEAFPNLFQQLEWWEERQAEDMPMFVKNTRTHEVYQLLSYNPNSPYALVEHNDMRTREHFQLLQPATSLEYEMQGNNTIESQLRPRYKLIADYPGNVQPVGHIHQAIGDQESIRYWCEEKEKYPQVFQRLEWWEYRTDSELPKYMKEADNPDIVYMFLASHKWTPRKIYVRDGENHEGWEFINNMFPATEQEFKNQPKYRG
jgi:hypothetical protein